MTLSEELARLAELHQRGALSEEEFTLAKSQLLRQASPAPLQALRRSRDDRWIGGVCGGLARVTGLPSWAWRLLFVLGLICAGSGALLYLVLWCFVPGEPPAPPVASPGSAPVG